MGQVFIRHLGRTRIAQEEELRQLSPSSSAVSPENGVLVVSEDRVPVSLPPTIEIKDAPVAEVPVIQTVQEDSASELLDSEPIQVDLSETVEEKPVVTAESLMGQQMETVSGSSLGEITVVEPIPMPAPAVSKVPVSPPQFPKGFQITKALNKRQKRALNYLKKRPFIKNKRYRSMFDISHKTAHLELSEMVSMGILRIEGSGRSTSYVLDQLPDEMNKTTQTAQTQSEPEVEQVLQEIKTMVDQVNADPVAPMGFVERKKALKDFLNLHSDITVTDYANLVNISPVIAEKDLNDFVYTEELVQLGDAFSLKKASLSSASL